MEKERDMDNINLEKEAPLLNSIPKSNPFVVPEGYFDGLPAQIMAKTRKGEGYAISVAVNKIFWLFRPQWMIATFVVIVCVGLLLRGNGNNSATNYEAIAATLPDSVIMQSLQNNIDYVDVSTLEQMTQAQGAMKTLQTPQDTTNKQIINYLINNNIDASDIENEL